MSREVERPMNEILWQLRNLRRKDLIREIRRVAGNSDILLWEQVPYNSIYTAMRAGAQAAPRLGIQIGQVIGYVIHGGHPMGSAIGDLMNVEKQNDPPFDDPFTS